MGMGRASGDRRALEAAQQAINSPLLEDVSIQGATGILINITGGPNLTLFEVNEACSLIQEAAHEEANIIFGSVVDSTLKEDVRITVIATGFDRIPAEAFDPAARSRGQQPQRPAQPITLPYGADRAVRPVNPQPRVPELMMSRVATPIEAAPEYIRPEDTARGIAAAAMAPAMPAEVPQTQAQASGGRRANQNGGRMSLAQVLADVEVEDELDIPTFLRRHNQHPSG